MMSVSATVFFLRVVKFLWIVKIKEPLIEYLGSECAGTFHPLTCSSTLSDSTTSTGTCGAQTSKNVKRVWRPYLVMTVTLDEPWVSLPSMYTQPQDSTTCSAYTDTVSVTQSTHPHLIISASETTYIVSGGALNSTQSLATPHNHRHSYAMTTTHMFLREFVSVTVSHPTQLTTFWSPTDRS